MLPRPGVFGDAELLRLRRRSGQRVRAGRASEQADPGVGHRQHRLPDPGARFWHLPENQYRQPFARRAALRCREPGTCVLGTASVVANVDGFILDGVQIRGGVIGLTIKASKNVLIKRSKFIEQTNSGILMNPGTTNQNIFIYGNEFRNALLGCNQTLMDNCYYLSDGSPIAEMDYGVRIYSTAAIDVAGNQFGTVLNHAISLKTNVVSATITGNIFNACGRTCIELGQETPASGEALVDNNILKGARLLDLSINNIGKAIVTNNIFFTTVSKIRIQPKTPETRIIVTTPNTFQ